MENFIFTMSSFNLLQLRLSLEYCVVFINATFYLCTGFVTFSPNGCDYIYIYISVLLLKIIMQSELYNPKKDGFRTSASKELKGHKKILGDCVKV